MGKQFFDKMDPILPQSSEKELATCSKSAEPISQSAKPTSPIPGQVGQANFETAKPTSSVAVPLAIVQVSLADSKLAKPTFMILAAADMPPIDSAPIFVPVGVEGPFGNQDGFAPQSAIFKKPADHVNHLKSLHVKGYINGKLVNNMLVDNGAMVNLMPYSLYKKLGGSDEEPIKTKRTAKGVGGNSMSAKGFTLMKLTIRSKTLATIFFVAEVQGSYNLILGREWIYGNRCVPSSLHQFLIQWVNNEVVIVHADSSAYTTADAPLLGGHDDMICLLGRDLAGFESLEEALFLFLKSRLMICSILSCSVNYV
jgi:hypothetical protein